ncbi:MAG: hypothetical protein JWO42_2008 [Chloroflexi bacterium]|jgi:hypothetical protein|nr:hypothetical protein [Chloroflexota bacterium]
MSQPSPHALLSTGSDRFGLVLATPAGEKLDSQLPMFIPVETKAAIELQRQLISPGAHSILSASDFALVGDDSGSDHVLCALGQLS